MGNYFFGSIFIIVVVGLNISCQGSHASKCVIVDGQTVCFVREIQGFKGDVLSLTTSQDACHSPVVEYDYVSNSMRSSDRIKYKIIDNKLFVFAETMNKPSNQFPIEVVLEEYDAGRDDDLIKQGYKELNLSLNEMTWCFSDLYTY